MKFFLDHQFSFFFLLDILRLAKKLEKTELPKQWRVKQSPVEKSRNIALYNMNKVNKG